MSENLFVSFLHFDSHNDFAETWSSFDEFSSSGCGQTTSSSFSRNQHKPCFELPANVLAGSAEDSDNEPNATADSSNHEQVHEEKWLDLKILSYPPSKVHRKPFQKECVIGLPRKLL